MYMHVQSWGIVYPFAPAGRRRGERGGGDG